MISNGSPTVRFRTMIFAPPARKYRQSLPDDTYDVNIDIARAKKIIAVLTEGVDPTTGEILPENSICNKGEIVRALHTVLNCLDEKMLKKNIPANTGKPWFKEDDGLLIDFCRSNISKGSICNTLQRTASGVAARLVHLGVIENRDVFRCRN